jgi:hypothetical protein
MRWRGLAVVAMAVVERDRVVRKRERRGVDRCIVGNVKGGDEW